MSAAVQTGRDENRLRENICALGRSIFERGLTAGSSGNVSVRLEDGWLFTPTNASLGRLDPARLSRLDASGKHVAGDPPSKESFLHRAMYEERDRAGAIVHLHSTHSAAVSCMDGLDHENCIPPLTAYFVMKIGRLPLIPYYRPGDPRLWGRDTRLRMQASGRAAGESRAGRVGRHAGSRLVCDRGAGGDGEAVSAAARHAGAPARRPADRRIGGGVRTRRLGAMLRGGQHPSSGVARCPGPPEYRGERSSVGAAAHALPAERRSGRGRCRANGGACQVGPSGGQSVPHRRFDRGWLGDRPRGVPATGRHDAKHGDFRRFAPPLRRAQADHRRGRRLGEGSGARLAERGPPAGELAGIAVCPPVDPNATQERSAAITRRSLAPRSWRWRCTSCHR